ncbi:amino acid ABC transporter ATP-binding protein [Schaalia sp. ZJ1691]|uniref:amino acid ABC transporter ATP-binding protein n=1 Tax=Schaalia sp. ZJ1691 TaxID=2709404 RepID=UPI0013ED7775|nr:amino acid ABC transporter ATP-binding protein [Schaalia sp. ZJ1691]
MTTSNLSDIHLSIRHLTKKYGGVTVVDGVNFDAPRGQVTAIIGPSGGGKSTLLRCINLLETPDSGTVTIGEHVHRGGERIPEAQLRQLRAKTGMVFQSYELFGHLSVLDNVTLAQRRVLKRTPQEATERARMLLERVGLADKADSSPGELSGGQQQRVAIARTLALDPEVLLFDEPTSALDPELSAEVRAVIRDLAKDGRTMLVVTHDQDFARDVADRLTVMVDGVLFTREELLSEAPAIENRSQGKEQCGDQRLRARAYIQRIAARS